MSDAEQIVRNLADAGPPINHIRDDTYCSLCGAKDTAETPLYRPVDGIWDRVPSSHLPHCIWRRAVEWVAANPAKVENQA